MKEVPDDYGKQYEGFGTEEVYDAEEEEVKTKTYRRMEVTNLSTGDIYMFEEVDSGRVNIDFIGVYTDDGNAWFSGNGYSAVIFDKGIKYSLTIKE